MPDFVDGIQNECDLSDDLAGNLMLLLSEAVTNAIEHGNQFDPNKTAEIEVEITDSDVIASVKDQGPGFKPADQENPLTEENLLKEGGRGVFLLKELSDEVEYLDGGTRLRFILKKH